ncbi:MAG: rhomboid family intramembrane serine protease [Candidatus Poseidoniales archaeon]
MCESWSSEKVLLSQFSDHENSVKPIGNHFIDAPMGYHFMSFGAAEWAILGLWFVAILAPLCYAIRHQTSLALSLTLSVLLGSIVQVLWSILYKSGLLSTWLWYDFVLVPSRTIEPMWWHTIFTSGFLHSNDVMHVLGNTIILALVGIPLEQRLGMKRYALVYTAGLFFGSTAWMLMNLESSRPALGASGAAFGLLGAYLAGWPKDEIPFPFILIRKWPITLIALVYFGLEILRAYSTLGLNQTSDVAHMAHLGGFLGAYICLPLIAKGGPVPLGIEDGGPSLINSIQSKNMAIRSKMVDLSTLESPWEVDGSIPKHLREPLSKLKQEGDEVETRLAWMEQISSLAFCPICEQQIVMTEHSDGPRLTCTENASHLDWPKSID